MATVVDKVLSKQMVKNLLGISDREFRELKRSGMLKSYGYLCDMRRRHYRLSDIVRELECGRLGDYLGCRTYFVIPRVRDMQSYVENICGKKNHLYDR